MINLYGCEWEEHGQPVISDQSIIKLNGKNSALVSTVNLVGGLKEFSIEIDICPESDGEYEQRFLHFGTCSEDRILLELRSESDNTWWLSTITCSQGIKNPIRNEKKRYLNGEWHTVCMKIASGRIENYVDGELNSMVNQPYFSIKEGLTSIGMRQNKISWFKGQMRNLRIQ